MKRIKITVPNSLDYLPLILTCITKNAEIIDFDKKDIIKIEMGAEEAISNVIKHAFDPDEDASFDVIFENTNLGMNLIIKEKGIPFDPSLIPEYKPENLSDNMTGKGLGVYLMRKFFDEVSFKNLGKDGRETHLFKNLKNKSIEQVLSESELHEAEKAKTADKLPKGSVVYDVRRMKSEEAVDVSKGAYSSYGYSYVLEHIYFPDRVREMNIQDELISFVCVTDEKEVIAHCALEMEEADPKIPQLGVAFTKPKYRGQGCLNRLAADCMKDADSRGLYGVYARGVTTHPYSQKSLLNFDLLDCAIYVSSGAIREYKGMEGTKQRESVVIHFKCLNSAKELNIYPPEHHKEIIGEIYYNIKLQPQFIAFNEKMEVSVNESVINIQTDQLNMVGKIRVKKYGNDILPEIQKSLKALCVDRMDTIYLYLKLSDPFTAKFTEEFENLGFFFGGVIPGSDNGDMLMLQYLNNYKIDYDKIKVSSEFGNKLLSYIKQRDNA